MSSLCPHDGTATLLCDGRPIAPVRIAASRSARYRGLLGTTELTGALLLLKTNGVHTLGMRYAIDVAYLSKDLRVIDVIHMNPNRWSLPRFKARHTLEASIGKLTLWRVSQGSRLAWSGFRACPSEAIL